MGHTSDALHLTPHVWSGVRAIAVTGDAGGNFVVIAVILFSSHKRSYGLFLRPKKPSNWLD